MKTDEVKVGVIVRVGVLTGAKGIFADKAHYEARRPSGTLGKVTSWSEPTPGEPGSLVVWVRHGADTAVYWNHELDLQGEPE